MLTSYVEKWRKAFNHYAPFTTISDKHLNAAILATESLRTILKRNNASIETVPDINWGNIKFKSPFYSKPMQSGVSAWNPRDILLPAGNCTLQAPLLYRQRSFE